MADDAHVVTQGLMNVDQAFEQWWAHAQRIAQGRFYDAFMAGRQSITAAWEIQTMLDLLRAFAESVPTDMDCHNFFCRHCGATNKILDHFVHEESCAWRRANELMAAIDAVSRATEPAK